MNSGFVSYTGNTNSGFVLGKKLQITLHVF